MSETGVESPAGRLIGYCTNVHPGTSLSEIKLNLERETLAVKRICCDDQPLGIGLWLSGTATRELATEVAQHEFRDWLAERELVPYTINAFPFGDFHQPSVKHAVYQPTWVEPSRLEYTKLVASIQDQLLPPGQAGTISTLPLGWPESDPANSSDEFYKLCAEHLISLAEHLDRLKQTSGRQVRVCLEPEPGCRLDTCGDVVDFFDRYLARGSALESARIRDHLGVCHDVCHSAVMFEPQALALDTYAEHEISLGKVQVSSAIEADFDHLEPTAAESVLEQLTQFCEPRYLHQTTIKRSDEVSFYDDLPLAIDANRNASMTGTWRVHFHVPIFASSLDLIRSTQPEILKCIEWFKQNPQHSPHFEVETYAWNVLPDSLMPTQLTGGIAQELDWLAKQMG